MEGQINCMHSKLQLLSHPTHLRVVVPSANLVPYDWGETGVMENVSPFPNTYNELCLIQEARWYS